MLITAQNYYFVRKLVELEIEKVELEKVRLLPPTNERCVGEMK